MFFNAQMIIDTEKKLEAKKKKFLKLDRSKLFTYKNK